MLARRFIIVCLLVMLFGMFFAILVERTGRPARAWEYGQVVPCSFEFGRRCGLPQRY